MDTELESDSNPLFGMSGGFKPSLTAIFEGIEREGSSAYVEPRDYSANVETKSSSDANSITKSPNTGKFVEYDVPQDANREISPEKRLSRFSSLSRMIRTKSGKVLKGEAEREEKEGDDETSDIMDGKRKSNMKKRASILQLFKQ